jgi:hypothetical protein
MSGICQECAVKVDQLGSKFIGTALTLTNVNVIEGHCSAAPPYIVCCVCWWGLLVHLRLCGRRWCVDPHARIMRNVQVALPPSSH